MHAVQALQVAYSGGQSWSARSGLARAMLRFTRRQPLGAAAALVLLLTVALAVLAPVVAPYSPTYVDRGNALEGPSARHWFGTDDLGRDVFSRTIYGSRVSVVVGLVPVLFGIAIGSFLGITSGFWGGAYDLLLQRVMDAMMAFPSLVLAMALTSVLAPGLTNVMIAISVIFVPGTARLIRSLTLSLTASPFVEAAHTAGASDWRILFVHILPNTMAAIFIVVSTTIGWAILIEASLGFLGLGVQPPTPSWGNMLSGSGRSHFSSAPWIATAPGLAIGLVVLAANLLGDALRDHLDPRLKTQDR
jgi:ABC-type dipeptide/oligopeptide/nickel transport system permease subunit